MPAATATETRLAERSYLPDARHAHRIDREAGVIRGVRVIGFESVNKRRYPREMLERSLAKYEGVDVNLDHAISPTARRIGDSWGVLRDPKLHEDGVYADLHYLTSHAQTPMLLEMAERFPRNFGLSHVAMGAIEKGSDGWSNVTEIAAIESVDVVRKPATNSGLFESQGKARRRRKASELCKQLEGFARADRLAKLLESPDYAEYGQMPVEGPVDMPDAAEKPDDAADALEQGVEALVMAILKQDLPAKDKLARISKILQAGEAPAGAEDDQTGADQGADAMSSTQQNPALGTPTPPQAAPDLTKEMESLKRQLAIREAYDAAGIRAAQLSESQRKLVEAQSIENVPGLLAEFKQTIEAKRPVEDEPPRPNVRRAVQPASPLGSEKYDDVLAEAKASTGRGLQKV